jgi:hypothetical protein
MKPDWSKSLVSSSGNPKEHTIFRVFNTEDTSLFGLFKTSDGIRFYVTDGVTRIAVTDSSDYVVSADRPTHVAVVWDFEGLYTKNAVSLIIDGRIAVTMSRQELLSYGYSLSFNRNSMYTLMLGGRGWEGLLSRYVSSADAVFENLKVYNYPKYDFSRSVRNESEVDIRTSSELIELSIDGINFFDYKSGMLPIIKENVLAGESFTILVRGKDLDKTSDGQFNRQPYIYVSRIKKHSVILLLVINIQLG